MKKNTYQNIILLIFSILLFSILGELAIRFFGYYDIDKNFVFLSRKLKPYHTPVASTKIKIDKYLSSSNSFLMYDSFLGWTPRPKSKSTNKLYCYNSDGIRTAFTDSQFLMSRKNGFLRIAIFGDSFTHGDGVTYNNTWGYFLKENLKKSGLNVEVLNFGVPAYAMDQAFLKWKYHGYKFSPDIVIFGFQPENVKRNVNMVRSFYGVRHGNIFPFTKPRFVLNNDNLSLINVPTQPPEKLTAFLKNIRTWKLLKYEYWYNEKDYQDRILLKSRLAAFLLDLIEKITDEITQNKNEKDFYSIKREPSKLSLKIVEEFKRDVESKTAKFYVLFLPQRKDINSILKKKRLPYETLLKKIQKSTPVIYPEYKKLSKALDSEQKTTGHYSAKGNRIIAEAVARYILTH